MRVREFTMKDSYSFDLDAAGLDRRSTRTTTPTSASSPASASRRSRSRLQRHHGRLGRWSSCARPRPARTRRALPGLRVAANTEALQHRPAGRGTAGGDAARPRRATPRALAMIATLVDHLNARDDLRRADGRPWAAADTLKNVVVRVPGPRRRGVAAGGRAPGRPRARPQAARGGAEPGRARGARPRRAGRPPGSGAGLHRPGGARRRPAVGHPLPRRPPGRARHRLGHRRRPAGPGTSSTSWPAATSPRTARSTPPRSARETRVPRCGGPLELGPGPGDRAHLPAGPPLRRGARPGPCSPRRQLCGPVTMGSYGIGTAGAVAAVVVATTTPKGLCWPCDRGAGPGSTWRWWAGATSTGRAGGGLSRRPPGAPGAGRAARRPARRLSPGVKLTDAELLGMPTLLVVGRGLA